MESRISLDLDSPVKVMQNNGMGKFIAGQPRPENAGRKAGTSNRKTEMLFEKCESLGIDPFESLLQMTLAVDPQIQLAAIKEVCTYLYPKRKAVEITSWQPGSIQELSDDELNRQINAIQQKLKQVE